MPPGTVAMVLAAAVAHAAWNLASKFKRGDAVLFVGAYTCASALLCVPISLAFGAGEQQMLDWRLWAGATFSAVLHTAYSLTLQAGYDRAELGVVYPVARGTGPVLTMLFAILLLGERLSTDAMFGASLVVAGILVVTGNPLSRAGRRPVQGLIWGAATGATIAAYTLWDGYSVIDLNLAPVSYYAATLLVQSLILAPSVLHRRRRARAALRADALPILIVAVFSPLAYILVLTAMLKAPVALVAPLRESSIVIGSLVACIWFREGHLARRLAGVAVVMAGIAVISL
jgi:drug/metabolite transporter (DMT)-like permease